MFVKYSILLNLKYLWNGFESKWPLESDSEPEIERKHLHYKDMANLGRYSTNLNWISHTLSISGKFSILLK